MTTTFQLTSGGAKARLLRRAQAISRLRHPNLVRLLPLPGGAGLSPVLGDARRLADFTLPVGTFKRFDLEQIVRLLLDVLSGLAALHEVVTDGEPFVHGGVSPQCIYIDEHGTARLVPLLNAHVQEGAQTEPNGYVAPELLRGDRADVRADVFSVGVMLWEALAGKRLFPEPTPEAVLASALAGKRPPLQLGPRLRWAQPLCAIAERAIALEPATRFRSALDLSNAVAAAVAMQLSRVDSDAWQDEAPTPVFQPRLHLTTYRSSTPPPAVLTLCPQEEPATSAADSSSDVVLEPHAARPRRRFVGALLPLVALAFGALYVSLPARQHSSSPVAGVAPVAAPLLSAVPPAPVLVRSVASAPPAASAAPTGTSAAPAIAASAGPGSARANQPFITPKAVPGAPKPNAGGRQRPDDYGI